MVNNHWARRQRRFKKREKLIYNDRQDGGGVRRTCIHLNTDHLMMDRKG